MKALSRDVAALALAIGMMFAPAQSAAGGHMQYAAVYLDSARCGLLSQQFEQAATGRILTEHTRRLATDGETLCHDQHFGQGADTLEQAVRLIGETPALPPAVRPLR